MTRIVLSLFLAMMCAVVPALVVMPMAPRLAPAAASRTLVPCMDGEPVSGKCKWFNVEKGYGFIALDSEDKDVFVHQSDIYAPGFRSLAEGEALGTLAHRHTRPLLRTALHAPPELQLRTFLFLWSRVPPHHGREDGQGEGRGCDRPRRRLRTRTPRCPSHMILVLPG